MSFAKFTAPSQAPHTSTGKLSSVRYPSTRPSEAKQSDSKPRPQYKPASRHDVDSLCALNALNLSADDFPDEEAHNGVRIHLFYDECLSRFHVPLLGSETAFERPERVKVIYEKLKSQSSFAETYMEFDADGIRSGGGAMLTMEDLEVVHSQQYLKGMEEVKDLRDEQLKTMEIKYENDVYLHPTTFLASRICASGIVECCRRSTHALNNSKTAVSISRPPGHHACANKAMGFCFLANVALAAKLSLSRKWARKVLIIDWDIHHGNGTQDLTYNDPNILYLSLHRQGVGSNYFYPGTGMPQETGEGAAAGTNVNITWNQKLMGNTEYLCAWSEVVLPVVHDFKPDLIIVSSGFDAAKGDLIGDCLLTPECYYLMTKSLLKIVDRNSTAIVVALEGGYNLEVIPLCQSAIEMALKGEEWDEDGSLNPLSSLSSPQPAAKNRISLSTNPLVRARLTLNKYWDYYEPNERQRGKKMGKGAANSVNRTIRALNEGGFFEGQGLRQVKEQIERRSLGTRKAQKGAGDDFFQEDDLDDMFGKLKV